MGGIDASLLALALALLVAGMLTGLVAGLFGIGGGGITVPALYEALGLVGVGDDIRMHVALGTALAAMSATTIRSFLSHRARGNVDMAFLRRVVPWVLLGVVLGAIVARHASSEALQLIWAIIGSLLAIKLALGRDDWRLGDALPRGPLVELWSVLVGVASTLMSVGGTAFMTTLMTLYGRPLLPALATCSGLGPVIAIPGAIGLMWAGWGADGLPVASLGYVNLIGLGLVMPAAVLMAPVGVRLAHGISKRTLELCFATMMGLISLRFIVQLLG